MNEEFIKKMVRREAQTAVGASTARNIGAKGAVKAARAYLERLDPNDFIQDNLDAFTKKLDDHTEKLKESLPQEAQSRGFSRKFLNIFLRNILYNYYLRPHFKFEKIERFLEVPLDGHTANGLIFDDNKENNLPKWKTIKNLDLSTHSQFQEVASKIAKMKNIERVHLDLIYWRKKEDE